MADPYAHKITLNFPNDSTISRAGVISATALFINAFVEGDVVQDRDFEVTFDDFVDGTCVIHANLRHPTSANNISREQAYASLYLMVAGWFRSGANVRIDGPWKDSFPSRGALKHADSPPLKLQPLFEDERDGDKRSTYPTLDTLAEIFNTLPHGSNWKEITVTSQFANCFPQTQVDYRAPNNLRLHHRTGLSVDVVLKQGRIHVHIVCLPQQDANAHLKWLTCDTDASYARTWWDAWIGHCPVTAITPKHLMILPDEVAVLAGFNSICRYRLDDMQSVRKPLEVEFGTGVHPTRAIKSWLSDAKRFGEANLFNIALKCCQQAIASANALLQSAPGIAIRLPLGVTARQQLENAEVEYLRWTVAQESLTQPQISHERWNDRVNFRGVSELTARLGSQWEGPLADLVEAINNEHYSSEDHHHQIGRIRDFFWKVPGDFATLKYLRLFGSDLMAAKVPQKALCALGYEFKQAVIHRT